MRRRRNTNQLETAIGAMTHDPTSESFDKFGIFGEFFLLTQSRRLCTGSVEFQVPCPDAAISARKPCQRVVQPCLCPSLPGFVCEHTIFSAVVPRTCVYLQIPPPRFIASKMGCALHRFHTIFWSFSHPFNSAFFSIFFLAELLLRLHISSFRQRARRHGRTNLCTVWAAGRTRTATWTSATT